MCRHAHSSDIVLKSARGYLGRDDGAGLWVDIVEVMGGGKRHGALEGFCTIVVLKRTHVQILDGLAPCPTSATGTVILEVLEYFVYIDGLVGCKLVITHCLLPPSNCASASCQSLPSHSASPAVRMSVFVATESL